MDSSSESDVDSVEHDDDENLVRHLSMEEVLRAKAQYWADVALARRLVVEEITTAGLAASPEDTVLVMMPSVRLSSFGHERGSNLRQAEASSSGSRRRRHCSGSRVLASLERDRAGLVSPPRFVGID